MVSAPRSGRGGREFKSPLPDCSAATDPGGRPTRGGHRWRVHARGRRRPSSRSTPSPEHRSATRPSASRWVSRRNRPRHRLVTIGDSITQGFMSGAIFRTDLSWPAIVADELGFTPLPLPHLRATRRSGRPPARPRAAGPLHRPHGGPDPQLERGARAPPGGSAATWTRSRTTGSGAGSKVPAHRPGLPQPGRLRLGPARRARPERRPAPGPHRRPSTADDIIEQVVESDNDRAGLVVARAGAGGRRDGPHGPRGRGLPRRGGRQRAARDRDPGRHARRQQRARRGRPPGRLLELGRLPGPDRRRTARRRSLVHRVPALALRGRVGRAGRGDPRHPGSPRASSPPCRR